MKIYENGIYRDLTPAELAEMQAAQEQEEREYWANIPYDEAVNNEVRKIYPQRNVEAIFSNLLAYPDNDEYIEEFKAFQKYREECKALVKSKKGLN